MASDELHVIGILDEALALSVVKAVELRALICDYLQIGPYYPVLIEVLNQQDIFITEESKIDLQAIFSALKTSYFLKNIPSYYNNRTTKYSIKLLRAALVTYTRGLLTMNELRDGANVHQLKEFETLSIGVPCTPESVHSMLWIMKKTINNVVLNKWINAHQKFYDQPGTLMVHEFIYLICNCDSKPEMFERIPKIPMNIKREYKTNLFHVDKDFPKTYETPDHKIQHFMTTLYSTEKVFIEGLVSPPNNPQNANKNKKQVANAELNQEDETDLFRRQLRSMVLTVGVKMKLKEYHQKLIRSRLNGKQEYDKLVINGFESLVPDPFNIANPPPLKPPKSPLFRNTEVKLARPQTAHQSQPSFNKTASGFKSPNMKIRKLSQVASPKAFASPEKQTRSVMNSPFDERKFVKPVQNLKAKTRLSSMSVSNMPLSMINKKDENDRITPMMSTQDTEFFSAFENIIDEEYSTFESQSKLGVDTQKRSKSIAFFNSSTVSHSNTRIYSAKPGSPHAPIPLSAKLSREY